jgi:hypothetical protein
MFQFPGFASNLADRYRVFDPMGYPIRTSVDQFLFADPHSFSQLITSFFASESLGIPHTLFLTSSFHPQAFAPLDYLQFTLSCSFLISVSIIAESLPP